jgi:hypothetical protein
MGVQPRARARFRASLELMDGAARTCFGYEVSSAISFAYAREGMGTVLEVALNGDEPTLPHGPVVHEWRVGESFHAELRQEAPERFRLTMPDSGPFVIDPQLPRIAVPAEGNVVKREERLWGVPAALCMLARGDHPLHAAAVDVDGEAIVLGAPGTFGKSTLAAGFAVRHRLLTEDLCCVTLDDRPAVIPGPAMLRLRPDVAKGIDVPGALPLEAGDMRLHLALDPRTRGDCAPVPISAVLLLRGGRDSTVLERVPPEVATRDLFALGFRLKGADEAARCFRSTAAVAAHVPVFNLQYPHRLGDLPRAVEDILRAL